MIKFKPKGAIFDVDDTLLDNKGDSPRGLHEKSRYAAVKEVGRRHGMSAFKKWTYTDNFHAFHSAPTHTLLGAIWNTLVMTGQRSGSTPDPDDPLVKELIELKMELHEDILSREGKAYPGAIEFVVALANSGLRDKMAVATTAYLRDLNIFFNKSGLDKYFPPKRIISIESVRHAKPHPEAFNLAFATLELTESDRPFVCAFEDNPRGIKSAQDAGLFVCAIATVYPERVLAELNPAPDFIAKNFVDLFKFFGLPKYD